MLSVFDAMFKHFLNLKYAVATWLMTGLCVSVRRTGRLSECTVWAVGYYRKEHLKDENK